MENISLIRLQIKYIDIEESIPLSDLSHVLHLIQILFNYYAPIVYEEGGYKDFEDIGIKLEGNYQLKKIVDFLDTLRERLSTGPLCRFIDNLQITSI